MPLPQIVYPNFRDVIANRFCCKCNWPYTTLAFLHSTTFCCYLLTAFSCRRINKHCVVLSYIFFGLVNCVTVFVWKELTKVDKISKNFKSFLRKLWKKVSRNVLGSLNTVLWFLFRKTHINYGFFPLRNSHKTKMMNHLFQSIILNHIERNAIKHRWSSLKKHSAITKNLFAFFILSVAYQLPHLYNHWHRKWIFIFQPSATTFHLFQ